MGKKIVTLINPNLVIQKGDNLGSGIPYMPLTLAYLAACLKGQHDVQVIDSFGENPFQIWSSGKFLVQGLALEETIARIKEETSCIILYYSSIVVNFLIYDLVQVIRDSFPNIDIIIVENPQAVIACSLKYIYNELLDAGIDYVVCGEPERIVPALLACLIDGNAEGPDTLNDVAYTNPQGQRVFNENHSLIENLDELPFPAWEMFPLDNYWGLKYAHGPMEGKYLAILTSRGCPFKCRFCVIPSTNYRKWRHRSPNNVVEEMAAMADRFGVKEFHLEDVNPTVNGSRIIEICRLILEKDLRVRWKLAAGSKIETLNHELLDWMKKSGCNYISFSPESGSDPVLRLMDKPFDHSMALELVKVMKSKGIKSQACFVLGFPGETTEDIKATEKYVKKLTIRGLDEIALFIMTPIPGTDCFDLLTGYEDYSELTFSPEWREDFQSLNRFRIGLYRKFFFWKCIYHPGKVIRNGINLLLRRFEIKAEMNIYRMIVINCLIRKGHVK